MSENGEEAVNVKDCFDSSSSELWSPSSSSSHSAFLSPSSSSSHSDLWSPVRKGDVCSSPGTSRSGDISNSSEANLQNATFSPPSSPEHHGLKRTLYSTYKNDPSQPIPRQTLFRWQNKRLKDESHQSGTSSSFAVATVPDKEDQGEEINDEDHGEDINIEQAPHGSEPVSASCSHSSIQDSIMTDQPCQTSVLCFDDSANEESDSDDSKSTERDENSDCVGIISSDSSLNDNELDSDNELCDPSNLLDDDEHYDYDSSDPFNEEHNNLYPGSSKSTDEAVFELLNIYVKNNLSKRALQDVLKFYSSSLPDPHNMPTSVHTLLKYVENLSIPMGEVEHFYCRPAMHAVASREVPCGCGSFDFGLFYELPIGSRLKFFFEHRGLADLIDKYSETRTGRKSYFITDILDGFEYSRTWQDIQTKYKVTLIMNTDGVRPYKSSKAKMWPLMCTIMEVPPQHRTYFTIVCGIWFDQTLKPKMNLFLKPFVDSLIKIHNDGGIVWCHPITNTYHRSPVRAPIMIADAPARAGVLNMQEHQAKYACNACEQKSNKLPAPPIVLGEKRMKRKRRFLLKEQSAILRTHESMAMQGRYAAERGAPKRGVKGTTVVENMPMVDLSTYVVAEYMHCVLTGVVQQFCSLWFLSRGDWYIGGHVTQINDFLCNNIHPPDYVSRLPRSLDNFAYFKANEFRSLLLYYSLIVVAPYLPEKYFQHWMLLVQAIFLLLTESISEEDLLSAEAMLRLFVRDLGALYGDDHYTYNVHQLTHLVLYVRRWGSLWCTSAFGFESFNGTLSNMLHALKHQGRQLINSMFLAQGAQLLKSKITMKNAKSMLNIKLLGKPSSYPLSESESACLARVNTLEESVLLYGRIMVGTEIYSCQKHEKNVKRNNSFVEFVCNKMKKYGRIISFCKFGSRIVCLITVFQVVHTKIFFHKDTRMRIKHIIPVAITEDITVCEVSNITQKIIQVGDYLCYRPNAVESNL